MAARVRSRGVLGERWWAGVAAGAARGGATRGGLEGDSSRLGHPLSTVSSQTLQANEIKFSDFVEPCQRHPRKSSP